MAALAFCAFLLWGVVPADGFLRNPGTGEILRSPFLSGIVAFIFLGGTAVGVAYGVGAGKFRNDTDVMNGMGTTIGTLGTYLVLVFFAAQFVAYFNWSNLGLIVAVKGADTLRASGLGGIPLMLAFVVLSAIINLFMGSASAKWAVMAPVFVPMFMLLGYAPELTQVAYRIGDSTTNVIAPMMSYFALIVAFFEKYDKRSGIGTVVATMLPYTIVFLVVWSVPARRLDGARAAGGAGREPVPVMTPARRVWTTCATRAGVAGRVAASGLIIAAAGLLLPCGRPPGSRRQRPRRRSARPTCGARWRISPPTRCAAG